MNEHQKKLLRVVTKKTGVSEEIARQHLAKNQYKINLALKSIEKEIYTETELLLRKYKDKETALNKVSCLVESKYQLSRKQWINFEDLKHLPSEIQTLVIIVEWLNFENFEDFEVALSFQLEDFTKEVENTFQFTRLAESLRKTEVSVAQVYRKYKKKGNPLDYAANIHEEIWKNQYFQDCERLFRSQKKLIIEKLYNFVETNINQFP